MAISVQQQSNTSLDGAEANCDDCDPVLLTGNEPITCASTACHNQHGSNLHFYRFPMQPQRCEKWVENCGNDTLRGKLPAELNRNHYLCSLHFDSSQFLQCDDSSRLVPDAVPTLFTTRAAAQCFVMDHDYLALPAPGETSRPPGLQGVTKPVIVKVAAPQGISILRQPAPVAEKALPKAVSSLTRHESEGSANNDSALSTPVAATKLVPLPKRPIAVQQQKTLTTVPQQKAPVAPTLQRRSLLVKRRFVPTPKESPLQKYMLLCAELKGDLKIIQKQKRNLETMFTGIQDVLVQGAKALQMEDVMLLTGALVHFQEDKYRREPVSSAEKTLSALWLKHTQKGDSSKVMKRPVIEVAVFVFDHTLPGQIILGKRKQLLGGGLYQVPCGKVEFGENWEQAAYREVLQSTSIHIRDMAICSVVDTVELEADYHSVTVFMRGVADSTETALPTALNPDCCDSWHWRPWDSLPPPSDLYWPLRDYWLEGLQPFHIIKDQIASGTG